METYIEQSAFFGVCISLFSYWFGMQAKKKWNTPLFNPLLISIALTISFLALGDIPYAAYNKSAQYISFLLTPATVCLAVPLYQQFSLLKKNFAAVIAGICSGVIASLCSVLAFSLLFHFDKATYITFLPKSITTAIGMDVSQELGGHVPVTVAIIIITGVFGNMIAEPVCKLFRITHPIARGIGIGSASHAVGTAKAMEMGEIEGAMSSLSIVVAGVLTVIGASIFASFY